MRDFHSIIKELKLLLAKNNSKKILDKDVANILEISQAKFATIKKRNTIPYKNLLLFCRRENLCSNELFFEN